MRTVAPLTPRCDTSVLAPLTMLCTTNTIMTLCMQVRSRVGLSYIHCMESCTCARFLIYSLSLFSRTIIMHLCQVGCFPHLNNRLDILSIELATCTYGSYESVIIIMIPSCPPPACTFGTAPTLCRKRERLIPGGFGNTWSYTV